MSLLPLVRELLLEDHNPRYVRPYRHYYQPVRVHRHWNDGWPTASTFDLALNELQNVMDNVNEAIGQYQSSALRDLGAGCMRTNRTEDGHLQIAIDVGQYKPEEINVKLCDDNLVVEAKTEQSENDSYHKAEFKRWVKLPNDCKQDAIRSTLTADKKLLIDVPVNKPIENSRSRNIPIDVQKAPEGGDKNQQQQQQQQNQQQQAQPKK